ncbi:hypothetical protein [Streptomyces chrestomyceticus]|uniref:hypothetical protein n=1 Tax=Streptomyces chrestomyceticus TaxID=68185 RepID=UPI0037A608C5
MNTPTSRSRSKADWVIGRVPGRAIRRTEDDCLALPLCLSRGDADVLVELIMTPAESELLHAALCHALDGHPPPLDAPECRMGVQKNLYHD